MYLSQTTIHSPKRKFSSSSYADWSFDVPLVNSNAIRLKTLNLMQTAMAAICRQLWGKRKSLERTLFVCPSELKCWLATFHSFKSMAITKWRGENLWKTVILTLATPLEPCCVWNFHISTVWRESSRHAQYNVGAAWVKFTMIWPSTFSKIIKLSGHLMGLFFAIQLLQRYDTVWLIRSISTLFYWNIIHSIYTFQSTQTKNDCGK